ncbi:hypothetical protein [Elioraea sp.]|uniref:hypothetical protein n=1 Tax=Elioraea sp. TaxID=2185103 RepID=UPI0025B9B172|nr:hypothetical protein [Elioraea sp.]
MNKSYILFSQSATGTGQRNTWDGGAGDGTGSANSVPGIVQGVPTTVASSNFNANANVEQVNGNTARHSLDFLNGGTYAGSGLSNNLADGRAFSGPAAAQNPVLTSSVVDGVLSFSLANNDWNGIKNLEMSIDTEDLAGLNGINIRNFVDVRIKLGDEAVEPTCRSTDGYEGKYVVNIENVKRGELIASESDQGVDATISLTTNLASPNVSIWQASFLMVGSQFGDSLLVEQGDMAGFAKTLPGQVFDNTGKLQLVVANMGGGDDVYNGNGSFAQSAVTLGTDHGQLFFGSAGTVKLGFAGTQQGATAQLTDWFDDADAAGLDLTMTAYWKTTGGNIATAQATSSLGDQAGVAAIPGTDFNAGFSQTSGIWTGPADLGTVQTSPALYPDVGGLGISQANRTEFFGTATVTNGDAASANGMYEINAWGGANGNTFSDVLVVKWDGGDAIAAKIDLNYFYCGENEGEVARIQLWNNGVLVDDSIYGPDDLLVPTGTFSATNGGEGSFIISGKGSFDEIRFVGYNTAAAVAAGDPSDYLVDGIELVMSGQLATALGGDVAYGGSGADNFLYNVANDDGVDTIYDFTQGQDQLLVQLGGDSQIVQEIGGDTIVSFASYDGGIILKGVTGLVIGTDIVFA